MGQRVHVVLTQHNGGTGGDVGGQRTERRALAKHGVQIGRKRSGQVDRREYRRRHDSPRKLPLLTSMTSGRRGIELTRWPVSNRLRSQTSWLLRLNHDAEHALGPVLRRSERLNRNLNREPMRNQGFG